MNQSASNSPAEAFDIKEADPNMAWLPADGDGVSWHLPYAAPMKLVGFPWFAQNRNFHRLPDNPPFQTVIQYPQGTATEIPLSRCDAFKLGRHSAGGQIRFRTDSSTFQVKGRLGATYGMDHMAFTGSAGFDLYLNCDGVWKYFAVTRTDHSRQEFSAKIIGNLERKMRDVILDFPLYNEVLSLAIGLDTDARIEAPTPFAHSRPIVWYGTSIQQGGCATRPGMAASNQLSRMLNCEIINLGFSGSGKGEPEMARLLAEIPAAVYLIDYTWNVKPEELKASLPRFLEILRAAHPTVPILLIGPTPGLPCLPEMHNPDLILKNNLMREEAEARAQAGDANIHYFDTLDGALGSDFWECTVDGCHLTDLGFYRFSQAIFPMLKRLLHSEH